MRKPTYDSESEERATCSEPRAHSVAEPNAKKSMKKTAGAMRRLALADSEDLVVDETTYEFLRVTVDQYKSGELELSGPMTTEGIAALGGGRCQST